MPSLTATFRFAFVLLVLVASAGCRVSGEFDPGEGGNDRDIVYGSPTGLPR